MPSEEHPPPANPPAAMQICPRLQDSYLARPAPGEPARPARPGRRSAATILIAPLCPGIVAAHCVKLPASLSARFHSVGRGAAEQTTHTHTHYSLKTPLFCSPDKAGPKTPPRTSESWPTAARSPRLKRLQGCWWRCAQDLHQKKHNCWLQIETFNLI